MKLHFILTFACCTFFVSLYAQKNLSERDAIRKVIELETKYYFDGNYEKWADTWAHEPTDYIIFTGPNDNSELIGWDNISAEYKPGMKNVSSISAEELATEYKKYDYQYKINGSLANVTFREGKGNFLTKTLEKQNGEWKITGMTLVYSTGFKLKRAYNKLKSFTGNWKLVQGSFKSEPADSNYKPVTWTLDIHETMFGVEFNSFSTYTYAGKLYDGANELEQLIPDENQNEIKYYDFVKSPNGSITAGSGTASIDSSGNLVIKEMYPDKPTAVQVDNTDILMADGTLHIEARYYNKDGKMTSKFTFGLRKMQ